MQRNPYLQGTIRVDVYPSAFQLPDKFRFPASGVVQWNVDNSIIVRWNLHVSFRQSADSISANASDKISEFENDVLSGSGFQIPCVLLKCAYVVRCQESYGESDLSMLLELLDYCPTLTWLLM